MSTGFDRRAFSYSSPATWNSIPISIKNCSSLYSFKRHLVLLHSPAHKQLTHSVWPPSDCPRLRFMLNAWLHVRVINLRIIIILLIIIISQPGDTLLPMQLGVATPGGCEAAIHATRRYMATMSDDSVLVKLAFINTFNCLHRDRMLKTIADQMPCIYRFCWLSYGNDALKFGDSTIWSEEGPQQGDPLGPLLFFLTIQLILQSPSSELVLAYMYDVTLGGSELIVADDITSKANIWPNYGLQLNSSNCEVISNTGAVGHAVLAGFEHKTTDLATLLGAPISTGSAMTDRLAARCADLARAVERLKLVSAHDALIMVALCNRADHYIFALWFLLLLSFFFFSSPNLSGRRFNVYRTSTHGVALV